PVVSVDWSDLDGRKQYFLIRAAVAFEGRALTLYEEVHDIKTKASKGSKPFSINRSLWASPLYLSNSSAKGL
ncbi:hypothetical protein JW498_20930, partial [Amphritea sp. RP18W]|nr:hypothetical protein [Amphritea pacifica]